MPEVQRFAAVAWVVLEVDRAARDRLPFWRLRELEAAIRFGCLDDAAREHSEDGVEAHPFADRVTQRIGDHAQRLIDDAG